MPMGNKKKGKKHKKPGEAPSADAVLGEQSVEPARVEGYQRLMIVEERLYELWEQRNGGEMNWVGEALGAPVDEEMTL